LQRKSFALAKIAAESTLERPNTKGKKCGGFAKNGNGDFDVICKS
jgi:hypothetical protein